MPFKTVLSDLDGTLVDTSEDVLRAFVCAFKENNLGPFPFDSSCIGPKAIEIIRAALPNHHESIRDHVLKSFRRHHDSSDLSNSRLFEGVEETILKLKSEGINFYVVTNKPKSGVLNCINRLQLPLKIEDCFSVGDFGTQDKSHLIGEILSKKELDHRNVVMVGDTVEDIISAQNNKLQAIYCRYGFGGFNPSSNEVIATVSRFSEVPKFVKCEQFVI